MQIGDLPFEQDQQQNTLPRISDWVTHQQETEPLLSLHDFHEDLSSLQTGQSRKTEHQKEGLIDDVLPKNHSKLRGQIRSIDCLTIEARQT